MAENFNFVSQGKSVNAELYAPPTGNAVTGLVVIAYGSDGLTDDRSGPWGEMIRGYAASLADAGFVGLIPNYLSVTETDPGPAVFDTVSVHRDHWQKALSDAIDSAGALPSVSPSRIGLLGFSLGGHLCLRLRPKANVLVEYFAPIFDEIGPAGTLTHAQIHHGEADALPWTQFANAKVIKDTLEAEGTSTELNPYPGAGHGFVGSDRANVDARRLSADRTLSFFQTYL